MLVVEPVDSLKHIRTRKMLDPISLGKEKDSSSGIGSDGETSDYQRSTPSPQDSNARLTELTEGLEKADAEVSPESPHHSHSSHTTSRLEWKTNASPDLGFVDYVDNSSNSNSIFISSDELAKSKQCCEPDQCAVISKNMPYSDNLDSCINSSLQRIECHNPLRRIAIQGDRGISSSNNIPTAKILLNKQLKVEIEKLPSVMASMVNSNNHPSLGFRSDSSRKRYVLANSNIQRTSSKKCPRFVSADQRKTPTNKTIPRTKELLLHPNLFNSFRITKPKSTNQSFNKCESSSSLNFETQSFYKFSDSCNSSAVNKQSDLIAPTSALSPTVILKKTEFSVPFSSSRSLDPKIPSKNDSENLKPLVCDEGSQRNVQDISVESGDLGDISCKPLVVDLQEENQGIEDNTFALPRKLRFPAVIGSSSAIVCKWDGCAIGFKTHGKLSDHIKTEHVVGQLEAGDSIKYCCLWEGCKVYGKKSSSKGWLEKHVPQHGGKFAFPCIVEGCRLRFSSQAMLERHVNSHFTEPSTSSAHSGPRKSIEGAPARKRLKRAGVKLKFRQLPFSARIFDFFDAGMMSGIRHQVASMEKTSLKMFNMRNDSIEFHSKAISIRKDENGIRKVQLKWIPEDLIPDEWVPLEQVEATKTIKICNLPEKSKQKLHHQLLFKPEKGKQSRKTKRVDPKTEFLTPDEVRLQQFDIKLEAPSSP